MESKINVCHKTGRVEGYYEHSSQPLPHFQPLKNSNNKNTVHYSRKEYAA